MKILFVITGLGLGGAETQVCNLCDEFSSLGHDVSLVYLYGNKIVSPKDKKVKIYSIGLKKTPLSLLFSIYRLVKLIKDIRPCVIHSHMVHANLIARIARIFCTVPVLISTAHNTNEGGKLRMLAYRYTDRLADLSTNVSQMSVNAFLEKKASFPNRMVMVPNGIDTSRFFVDPQQRSYIRNTLGVYTNELMVIAVGRNVKAKDYDNLLLAVSKLPTGLAVKIFVVGLNTEQLVTKAKDLGIENKINFLGLRYDIPDLMAAADIFIMSSEWEGLPIVIGEAMACECAVVTTDAGGAAEWLPNHDYVVPTKNPTELSRSLTRLVQLPLHELNSIGHENREYILQNFSLSAVTKSWLEIYTKLL